MSALDCTDLVYYFLSAAARTALESIMQSGNYQYQSDFAKKYYSQGRTEGLVEGRADRAILDHG